MAGNPYSKFFWADWATDPALLVSSLAAQGLWMRLLCIAAESSTIGHVLIAGRKPTLAELVTVTRAPPDQIERLIAELIRNKVCDVTREGVLVSRRMVRDCRRRQISSDGGKARQKQIAETKEETSLGSSLFAQPPSTRVQSPESSNHSQEAAAGQDSEFEPYGKIAQLSDAVGFDLTAQVSGHKFVDQLISLLQQGFDFEQDILPAVRDARAAGKVPRDLRSLEWFRQRFESKRAQRKVKAIAAVPDAEPTLTKAEWVNALKTFVVVGAWVTSEWGPKPTEPGCKAPRDLLAEAERAWSSAGNHPRSTFDGNSLIAWTPERSDFKQPAPFAAVSS